MATPLNSVIPSDSASNFSVPQASQRQQRDSVDEQNSFKRITSAVMDKHPNDTLESSKRLRETRDERSSPLGGKASRLATAAREDDAVSEQGGGGLGFLAANNGSQSAQSAAGILAAQTEFGGVEVLAAGDALQSLADESESTELGSGIFTDDLGAQVDLEPVAVTMDGLVTPATDELPLNGSDTEGVTGSGAGSVYLQSGEFNTNGSSASVSPDISEQIHSDSAIRSGSVAEGNSPIDASSAITINPAANSETMAVASTRGLDASAVSEGRLSNDSLNLTNALTEQEALAGKTSESLKDGLIGKGGDSASAGLSGSAGESLLMQGTKQKASFSGDFTKLSVASLEKGIGEALGEAKEQDAKHASIREMPFQGANPLSGRAQIPINISFSRPEWSGMVAERTAMMAAQNISVADMQLDPPELGPMQVKVSVTQDQASVSFIVANPAVRESLDQSLARLRELFASQGLDLVNVDVSDQQQFSSEQGENGGEPSFSGKNTPDDESVETAAVQSVSVSYGIDSYA